jgi:hypothetical protein
MEEKITEDCRMTGAAWPDRVDRDVVGGEADQEVRIQQLAFMPDMLDSVESIERMSDVPVSVKVQAPSRCGMPRSQSSSEPPRFLNAGTKDRGQDVT